MLNTVHSFSQTSVLTLDTIPNEHRWEVILTVDSDFSAVDSMKVEMLAVIEEDTSMMYTGDFDWTDMDPIDFYIFNMNDTQTELTLGLGYYDPKLFIPRVYLYRGSVEELIDY